MGVDSLGFLSVDSVQRSPTAVRLLHRLLHGKYPLRAEKKREKANLKRKFQRKIND
ncbi:MAG: hypothetical protein V8T36_05185 [Ruthenibacterium lactatiformans]